MNDMAMNGSLTVNEKAYRILRLLGKERDLVYYAIHRATKRSC